MDRRNFLSGFIGCSVAASPLVTPVAFAQMPSDHRLVVILLRGAMDGLDVVQPLGDPWLARHRQSLISEGASDLDGYFALHPELSGLMPLWQAGELGAVHAVSTPYRDRRSHFDGQDLLENGGDDPTGALTSAEDGWLNRLLSEVPGATRSTAYTVGRGESLILRGDNPSSAWEPRQRLAISPQAELLLEQTYAGDPLFASAAATAFGIAGGVDAAEAGPVGQVLAAFTAQRLLEDTRIATFSLGGWDTHRGQSGALRRALRQLQEAILTLRDGLGPVWGRTAVVAITEFGRTVRQNGTAGTDHGTGGAAILAGGALSAARVHGRWPGLSPENLLEDRDLQPTDDIRRMLAWLLRDLFGVGSTALEARIFPGVTLGQSPRLVA